MNNLLKLIDKGQSYWMDNLTREKIVNGELKRRVAKEGLRGVTTNPSIFNKAISTSKYYDNQIIKLFDQGKSVNEVYEELTIKDVQDACDILRPVFDQSGGTDGFVSLEVSPHLAYETERTKIEARRLFEKLNRINCFIKIPATAEGILAIEEMLYEGININVTLIFSVETYKDVAEAYIKALERRAAEGKSIKQIRSVASFFLSRIDVDVDMKLTKLFNSTERNKNKPDPKDLLGKTAIASAKLAYSEFANIFSGKRWDKLFERNASVQRPLWASTGNKNPEYSDVKYVESLIGYDTVNTIPDATISAFADHGKVIRDSILEDLDSAKNIKESLQKLDIDLDEVTAKLLSEGVEKFKGDYDQLLLNLSGKEIKFAKDE